MTSKAVQGMTVNVYRSQWHSTNGPTSYAPEVLLIGEGVPEIFESGGKPIFKVVRRNLNGRIYIHAEPIESAKGNRMFGGNFIYSSDGRFPNDYPIPVHDREEPNDYHMD